MNNAGMPLHPGGILSPPLSERQSIPPIHVATGGTVWFPAPQLSRLLCPTFLPRRGWLDPAKSADEGVGTTVGPTPSSAHLLMKSVPGRSASAIAKDEAR